MIALAIASGFLLAGVEELLVVEDLAPGYRGPDSLDPKTIPLYLEHPIRDARMTNQRA